MSDERNRKNGVTMPQAGSKTRRVWDIATGLSEKFNRPATREEVLKACEDEGISEGTRETQYSHWKRFHGLLGRVVKPGAAPTPVPPKSSEVKPAAKKAAKQTKENKVAKFPKKTEAPPADEEAPPYDHNEGGFVSNSDAYDAGWNAYCDGMQETNNPYEDDTQENSDWTMGFRAAKEA